MDVLTFHIYLSRMTAQTRRAQLLSSASSMRTEHRSRLCGSVYVRCNCRTVKALSAKLEEY